MVPTLARSAAAKAVTLLVMPVTAVPTQLMGFAWAAHAVTSLPPMDTVIRPMCPRWAVRNASAAAAWVVVGYSTAPVVCGRGSGQPTVATREVVVAPPHPKLASFRRVLSAT